MVEIDRRAAEWFIMPLRFLKVLLPAAAILLTRAVHAAAPAKAPRRGTSQGVPDAHLDYAPGKAPKFWSVAMADTVMARYPDYRQAYWKPWSYVHGYMFCGMEMLYRSKGDRKYLDYIKRYIDEFVDDKGKFRGDNLNNLDNFMTGNAIVMMFEETHDPRYRAAADQFRSALDDYPRSDGQFWHGKGKATMWIDGVFMGQMFVTRYGKSIGDSGYCFDEAARQITVFARHCQKGDTGLYLHAWAEHPEQNPWADAKTALSPEVWSEGLGWYALIIPQTLAVLPQEHPQRHAIENIYRRLAAGLKRTQAAGGGWYMIVDKGDRPDNWIDPSGTAMFVYSIQRGIALGVLEEDQYAQVVAKGYKALVDFATVNDRGLVDLRGGGDGIGVKKDYASYVSVKRVLNAKEAVGGFLWATAIVEKPELEKGKVAAQCLNRAKAHFDKHEFDKAIAACDKALELDTDFVEAYGMRARARMGKAGYDDVNNASESWADCDKALGDCDKALRIDANFADAYISRACVSIYRKEYTQAAVYCDKALALATSSARAYCTRGHLGIFTRQYDKTIADCTKALALDSKLAEAFAYRGGAGLDKGEYDKALADSDKALALDPKIEEAQLTRGLVWAYRGNQEKAIAEYKRALELIPDEYRAINDLGVAHWMQAQEQDRRAAAAEAAGDQKTAKSCHQKSADLKKQARANWVQGITARPTATDILSNLGYACTEAKDLSGAEKYLKRAVELQPDKSRAHNNYGRVLLLRIQQREAAAREADAKANTDLDEEFLAESVRVDA